MTADKLTDADYERIGREWAAINNTSPSKMFDGYSWYGRVPTFVGEFMRNVIYQTQQRAFVTLGRALTEVWRQVPVLPDPRVEQLIAAAENVLEWPTGDISRERLGAALAAFREPPAEPLRSSDEP